jgi:hypothetical protein
VFNVLVTAKHQMRQAVISRMHPATSLQQPVPCQFFKVVTKNLAKLKAEVLLDV